MREPFDIKSTVAELKNFTFFSNLEDKAILELCTGSSVIVSKHKGRLYHFGDKADAFGIVLSGAYKLSRPTPNGEDSVLYFSTPGDVIAAFIMNRPTPAYPVSATAMGTSRFLQIPRQTYLDYWSANPNLLLEIQKSLSSRMIQLQTQKSLSSTAIPQRVAHLLMELSGKNASRNLAVREVPIPLTRQEISDSLDVAVESVIRIMSHWSKAGIISSTDSFIRITDLKKLTEIANDDT